MTTTLQTARTRPLVAVLYRVPLFAEAMLGAFEGFADVQVVPAGRDSEGVLRWLEPDALVLDGDPSALELDWGGGTRTAIVAVDLELSELRVRHDGDWDAASTDTSPTAIRNAVIAGLAEGARE